ncbi:MAG: PAS domain S-box protein [Nitrospirae bacterium]|nr:PAS domain S-box protein [Nitrospirota bacterium]NTW66167.1 PAS domain S-box protein [Nitrospirota bacterium]
MRIQTKIIGAAMLVVAAINVIYAVYLINEERTNALARLQSVIADNDRLLKIVTVGPLYDGNVEQLDATLDSFFANKDIIRIDLQEYKGNIRIYRTRTDRPVGEEITSRVVITRMIDQLGEIRLTYSTARIEAALKTRRIQILFFSGMLALGLSGIIFLLVKGLTRPIDRLTTAAQDMANGHLDREIDTSGAEELHILGQSFIRMRDAIREKMEDLAARNEALRISEDRLRSVVENTPVVLFALDPQGRFTLSEGKGLAVLGLRSGQVVGQSALEIYRDSPTALAGIRRALAGEAFSTTTDIGGLVFEVWYSPVKSAADELLGTIGVGTDITMRKRAEEEQQKLIAIIETSSDFIATSDLSGRLLYVNAAGRSLVGLDSVEEALSKKISDFLRQQDLSVLEKEQLPSILQAGGWTGELALRHFKTGVAIPVEMNAFMIRDQSTGRPIALANISRDITERKRAENALRESRNLLQTVLDTIPVRVFWKDRDLRYLGCNQPFALDAGVHSPEEMIGKDDYQMGWREQADLYRSDDRRVLDTGTPKLHYEEPQTTPVGRRIWLRTNKVPLKNAEGAIGGVLGTYEDITEYKQAEESLRQAALIVENSPVMLFRWRAVEGWPIVLVSQNVVQLGYTPEELLSGPMQFSSMVHPEDLEQITREVQTYTESGVERFQQEYRIITKDGHVRWIDDRTKVERDDAGRVTHYQGIVVDITERKRAEAERERLIGELELRNAELERFTYTVSHDLKSPLITMRGFLGYLEKDALVGNTERIKTDIGRIMDATDKMDRLLRELLELSRIGRVMSPPEQVPFEEIAREAAALVAGRLQECGIRVEIATGMPVVSGDHVRLVEVVQNLVDNAAKFMGSQPEPLIEIGVREEELNGKPVFFVRDNGIGIDPRYHEKIFGLFDKLDPKSEGTGIGLALVKRIIEVHGGTIWLESGGAGGSTFCFTLPRSQTTTMKGG